MKKIVFILLALPLAAWAQDRSQNSEKPGLVVNIVISGVSYDLLEKFRENLSDEGFSRFAAEGTSYLAARYNYMQTLSPTGLATLTTGATPSMHGVVSSAWVDYVTGNRVELVDDGFVRGLGGDAGEQCYSPLHIVMPTLGDKLLSESPSSKVVSIAADHTSAIVAGGQSAVAYWMDPERAVWVSSTAYMERLADWVVRYNTSRPANLYIETGWTPARIARQYKNSESTIFAIGGARREARITSFRRGSTVDYNALVQSPVGNTLVADFAARLVKDEQLGRDGGIDILNVCFDASRWVVQKYGITSMEVEDMIYRLDMDLGAMVRAIRAEVGTEKVLFTLTSDHGMMDTEVLDRFNVAQFKTILNSFLGVQFGAGDWVLDYIDRQVYLNHNTMYRMGLSIEEVQNRAAAFVLQFRGVSHVLTSTALAGGYFGSGWGRMMQNGFYPRRAGDLMLNLMPGWVEERPDTRTLSGSMYDYDTHVPLLVFGWKIPAGKEVAAEVDMTALAPTLAHFIGIGRPIASDGAMLPEIVN